MTNRPKSGLFKSEVKKLNADLGAEESTPSVIDNKVCSSKAKTKLRFQLNSKELECHHLKSQVTLLKKKVKALEMALFAIKPTLKKPMKSASVRSSLNFYRASISGGYIWSYNGKFIIAIIKA